VGLAGCTGERRTLQTMDTAPEIGAGSFYHEPLEVGGSDTQVNLKYRVAAQGTFDVFLFGGQSDPAEFGVYRRAVEGETDAEPEGSEWHTVLGADGSAEVNRPLSPGQHHFVVDNTEVGEASPDGPLQPSIALRVRDFDPFSV
jgi:hypothetical protein